LSAIRKPGLPFTRPMENRMHKQDIPKKITNSKPIPHIPLPFKEVIADVLRVKPPEKEPRAKPRKKVK
jgi:hypothetical protein